MRDPWYDPYEGDSLGIKDGYIYIISNYIVEGEPWLTILVDVEGEGTFHDLKLSEWRDELYG